MDLAVVKAVEGGHLKIVNAVLKSNPSLEVFTAAIRTATSSHNDQLITRVIKTAESHLQNSHDKRQFVLNAVESLQPDQLAFINNLLALYALDNDRLSTMEALMYATDGKKFVFVYEKWHPLLGGIDNVVRHIGRLAIGHPPLSLLIKLVGIEEIAKHERRQVFIGLLVHSVSTRLGVFGIGDQIRQSLLPFSHEFFEEDWKTNDLSIRTTLLILQELGQNAAIDAYLLGLPTDERRQLVFDLYDHDPSVTTYERCIDMLDGRANAAIHAGHREHLICDIWRGSAPHDRERLTILGLDRNHQNVRRALLGLTKNVEIETDKYNALLAVEKEWNVVRHAIQNCGDEFEIWNILNYSEKGCRVVWLRDQYIV